MAVTLPIIIVIGVYTIGRCIDVVVWGEVGRVERIRSAGGLGGVRLSVTVIIVIAKVAVAITVIVLLLLPGVREAEAGVNGVIDTVVVPVAARERRMRPVVLAIPNRAGDGIAGLFAIARVHADAEADRKVVASVFAVTGVGANRRSEQAGLHGVAGIVADASCLVAGIRPVVTREVADDPDEVTARGAPVA
jgi:hypothetical protein